MMGLKEKIIEIRRNRIVRILTDKYILCVVIFVVIGIIDPNGFLSLARNNITILRQKKEIVKAQKALDETQRRIDVLSSDRDSLETFAREEYYFLKDGEDVYVTKD